MVQETIYYYVHNDINVYGLLLDTSKAFANDQVIYCKTFHILDNKGFYLMYNRLLLNMYANQKLRFRCNSEFSEQLSVTNGMKQGGVISPILFCVYMDPLLNELDNSGSGVTWVASFLEHLTMQIILIFEHQVYGHCIKWLVYRKGMHKNLMFYLIQRKVK